MNAKVFYELWQMECCGKPFKVGDPVEWYVISAERLIRPFEIDGLEYIYDAHFDDWDGIYTMKGVVCDISVYYERYELVTDSGHNLLQAVPGIFEVIAIDSTEGVEKYRGELQASGFIVGLDAVSVSSAKKE